VTLNTKMRTNTRGGGAVGEALGLFAMSRAVVRVCWQRSGSQSSAEGSDEGDESAEMRGGGLLCSAEL